MEAFGSVAKFLRRGSAAAAATTFTEGADTANTIITAAVSPYSSDGEEDGPYFDMEFTVPEDDIDQEEPTEKTQEDDNDENENGSSHVEDSDHENEEELELTVFSNGCTEENVTICGSEESSSVLLHESEQSCKFPVSVLKSAAKFGVVLLKLKKSRSEQTGNTSKTEENQGHAGRKFLALKFKVEEVKMPFASLFNRENESKGKTEMKKNAENSQSNGVSDDRKLKKKYFKMVKPSHVRVSKGYLEKLKFHGQLNVPGAESETGGAIPPPDIAAEKGKEGTMKVRVKTRPKQWNDYLQIGLLAGKSGSASAAVAVVPASKMASNRRDDSLLQVQDGIQGAILHCKRSFNASTDT